MNQPMILLLSLGVGLMGNTGSLGTTSIDTPPAPKRPQEPTPPFPYHAEDVTYDNTPAGIQLAGTLTTPHGPGPFPAAIMITGSGLQDRNEGVFGHKPFLVIADHLTQKGIAVLRVDDRGIGGSTTIGPEGTATSFDFASDVEAGISFLLKRPRIDPTKIGLIGHSEGGMIAPIVAARDPRVAFIVLLAGPGIPIVELLHLQTEALLRADAASDDDIAAAMEHDRKVLQVVMDTSLSLEAVTPKIQELMQADPSLNGMTKIEKHKAIEHMAKKISTPWFRTFARYDPGPALVGVTCPVLAVNGELDCNVTCQENLIGISLALAQGGNTDVTIRAFPGLNHAFQHCQTGAIEEIAQLEETISVEVLNVVADWITSRFIK
jgi:pimeloyl-ACP methyl ester carboxylesterase